MLLLTLYEECQNIHEETNISITVTILNKDELIHIIKHLFMQSTDAYW